MVNCLVGYKVAYLVVGSLVGHRVVSLSMLSNGYPLLRVLGGSPTSNVLAFKLASFSIF